MRILLDECVHAGVKRAFLGHEVRTVGEIGRRSTTDSGLLDAVHRSFDVFVTIDRKLPIQQQIQRLSLGVILVRVRNNTLDSYRPLFPRLAKAAEAIRPGELIEIE